MAVVMEFKSVYGVRVRVLDDYYRDVPIEEQRRRRQETAREILRIDRACQLARMMEAEEHEQGGARHAEDGRGRGAQGVQPTQGSIHQGGASWHT